MQLTPGMFERAELPYFQGRESKHEVELPNGESATFPGRVVEAVFPLLLGKTPFIQEEVGGGRFRLHMPTEAPYVLGTAFVVGGKFGAFLTAAHCFPDNFEELCAVGRLAGFFVDGPQSFHLLPITGIALDRDRDLAVGTCANASGGQSTLPLDFGKGWPEEDSLLVTIGFPKSDRTSAKLHLYPELFVGYGWERVEGSAQVSHGDESITIQGPFVRSQVRTRPGHSGGPLLAYRKTEEGWRGHVVALLSWVHRPDEVEHTWDVAHFVSITPALDLPLAFMGGKSLREAAQANATE